MKKAGTEMDSMYFNSGRIAEGYKKRPFLHGQVIEQFRKKTGETHFQNGIDIGCGAGLSAIALKKICDRVTGIDCSAEMISAAREFCKSDPGIRFLVSRAEEISQLFEKIDIVTAAGEIQWIDRETFLKGYSWCFQKEYCGR